MTCAIDSFRDLIARWPSAEELGRDLGKQGFYVRQWRRRNSIPAPFWTQIVAAAERRGITGVSFDVLAKLAASQPTEAAQ